jgi:hypothetical protein
MRRWPLAAAASAAGMLIAAAPTVLALHIVAHDTAVVPVGHYEPAIATQAAIRVSPVAGWPATLRLALRIGFLVAEPSLDARA